MHTMVRGREYARFSDLGSFARMKELERRFAEPFRNYRRRPMQLVDGIDIVRALVGMGLAERNDIAKVVQESVRQRDEKSAANLSLHKEIAKAVSKAFEAQERSPR